MTLTEVCEKLELTPNQLAEKFDPPLSRQAVFYWKTKGIPKLRQYEIKEMIDDTERANISEV
jgi:predicted chitinase|tara:strand:- start:397 stop:582 length:186 start_codon:yes stop_codon:yes gene_type:complete